MRGFLAAGLLCSAGGLVLGLGGCTRSTASASETRTLVVAQQKAMDEARQQMELVPPPSKTRYLAVKSLTEWENPAT